MIVINSDLGYLKVAREQEEKIEQSRRLHERLAQCDKDLRDLEDTITSPKPYNLVDYNRRFLAITQLRAQTRKAIEALEDDQK